MPSLLRRFALGLLAALALTGAAVAADRVGDADVALGNPNAAVTVIEYASVTCPHCARFDLNVFPTFKARYIDTGMVRYIFREFPTSPENIAAAGFLIARCAGPERYFPVVEALFHAQDALYKTKDVHAFFMVAGQAGGLTEEQMKSCITDSAALAAFDARVDRAVKTDKIESTPTILVNGRKLDPGTHEFGMADLDAALKPLLGPNAPRRVLHRHINH